MTPLPKPHPDKTLQRILSDDVPLLDVRAPAEFVQGHLPNSINLPILDDDQRHQVGLTYKTAGQHAATKLGHQLVSGALKQRRIDGWLSFHQQHPHGLLMCWRGGARSHIAQQWLATHNCQLSRVQGGYKALRRYCLSVLEQAPQQDEQWWVLAGRTGSGKTELLKQLRHSIDLERLANHRGSAFGAQNTAQPSLASFENHLAQAYVQLNGRHLVVEDESRMIGRLALPAAWHAHMQAVPLVMMETDLPTRVANIQSEYVDQPMERGASELALHYQQALQRISRRLGGVRYQKIRTLLEAAFQGQAPHSAWIGSLLTEYYDPMYDYQLARKRDRICFRGTPAEVQGYLQAQTEG